MELTIALMAFTAPVVAVVVGYMLTSQKLARQDRRVEQVHVLVNSQLQDTLSALTNALISNIRLKEEAGEHVTDEERATVAGLQQATDKNTFLVDQDKEQNGK